MPRIARCHALDATSTQLTLCTLPCLIEEVQEIEEEGGAFAPCLSFAKEAGSARLPRLMKSSRADRGNFSEPPWTRLSENLLCSHAK
eukprot:1158514-Pelagomonas_calceolata.AAC.12